MLNRVQARWIAGVVMTLLVSVAGAAEDATLRAQLFGAADQALAEANAANANILAPTSYALGARHYRDAEQALARGGNLEDIRGDLAEAAANFAKASKHTTLAQVTLGETIAARNDAEVADSAQFASEQWRAAEVEFADAARRLEAGNINRAQRIAEDARELYRTAELAAIEANYLSGARELIAQAKKQRVKRYAPKTLDRAESLLADAENRLRTDRYDTDYPRSLAREANYEARHAMYLAERIRAMGRNLSAEDLLLEAEQPLTRVAGELDLVAELDSGYDSTTTAIVNAIDSLEADQQRLFQRDERVAFLESEVTSLESRLGEASQQRRLQEQIEQRFAQLAAVFTRDEAVVLRKGDDVIVRMSLNFDSGSPVIKPQYFTLLRKIQTAVDLFPDSLVEIQGHTDSFGADATNLELSRQRADAVQTYLMANMTDLGKTEITAVGYGETVPLSNNETPEGRQRNRRIDLLITPNIERLSQALASQ
ncbi:MAG: OmpA family protein [Pseudomonadales bacterium]